MGTAVDVDQLVWDLACIRCALARPVNAAVAAELREREDAIVAVLRELGLLPAEKPPPPPPRERATSQAWF